MKHNNEKEQSESYVLRWGRSIDKEKKKQVSGKYIQKAQSTQVSVCVVSVPLRMQSKTSGIIDINLRVVSVFSAKDRTRLPVEKEGSCSKQFPFEENGSGLSCVAGNRNHS